MSLELELNPTGFDDWKGLLGLLRDAFSYMDPIISPSSSLHRMDEKDLQVKAGEGDLFLLRDGDRCVACLFGTLRGEAYYLDKFAVHPAHQAKGHGSRLMEGAARRARDVGAQWLEVSSRVELTANHAAFIKMGFQPLGAACHPGYDRPTSLSFRRDL